VTRSGNGGMRTLIRECGWTDSKARLQRTVFRVLPLIPAGRNEQDRGRLLTSPMYKVSHLSPLCCYSRAGPTSQYRCAGSSTTEAKAGMQRFTDSGVMSLQDVNGHAVPTGELGARVCETTLAQVSKHPCAVILIY
jgi:hypothetical protein